jgi:hypothetical protein
LIIFTSSQCVAGWVLQSRTEASYARLLRSPFSLLLLLCVGGFM